MQGDLNLSYMHMCKGMFSDVTTQMYRNYGKCPKISNTKVSDKMTYVNSADPDQTAPKGLIRVYTVCHSTKYFKQQVHKKQNLDQNGME